MNVINLYFNFQNEKIMPLPEKFSFSSLAPICQSKNLSDIKLTWCGLIIFLLDHSSYQSVNEKVGLEKFTINIFEPVGNW